MISVHPSWLGIMGITDSNAALFNLRPSILTYGAWQHGSIGITYSNAALLNLRPSFVLCGAWQHGDHIF